MASRWSGSTAAAPDVDRVQVVGQHRHPGALRHDLHSIHIRGGGLNFHLYGLALERLDGRRFFQADDATWQPFPAHPDIREARDSVLAGPRGTAPT